MTYPRKEHLSATAPNDGAHSHGPDGDHDHGQDVHPQLLAAATRHEGSAGLLGAVRSVGVDPRAEEASADHSDHSSSHVDRRGVERVVNLHLLHGDGKPKLEETANDPNDETRPRLGHGHAGGARASLFLSL